MEAAKMKPNPVSTLGLILLATLTKTQEVAQCQFQGDITGTLSLGQKADENVLTITGELTGTVLADGQHGFHVHEKGSLGNGCKDAGGHYNPLKKNHSSPENVDNRHVGDLGNVESAGGTITIDIKDTVALLQGDYSIMNRAIVLHEGKDDFGLGGQDDSLTTGHAGARLGCCIIEESTSTTTSGVRGENLATKELLVVASALALIQARSLKF